MQMSYDMFYKTFILLWLVMQMSYHALYNIFVLSVPYRMGIY